MKRALVVSGGGSKGAFAVGVIKELTFQFPNLDFDILVGTSTGALIVPLVALNDLDLLEKLYTTHVTDDIVLKGNLGDVLSDISVFDATPLTERVKETYNDQRYQALIASGKHVYFNCTCLQSRDLVCFTTNTQAHTSKYYKVEQIINADHFRRAITASACQPVFMQPVKINKHVPGAPNPEFQFVDGGVREYAGIQMAIDAGATEIFVILLSTIQQPPVQTIYTKAFQVLTQTMDVFLEDVSKNDLIIPFQYNEALDYIEAVKKKIVRETGKTREEVNELFRVRGRESPYEDKVPLKIFVIRPNAPLGGGPGGLTFDPTEMQGMVSIGSNQTNNFIAGLDPADISWA